jgi:ATP-dependent helicase IRC3
MFEDRPYQTESKEAVSGGIKAGVWKQLVQMATGTGKTIVFAKLYEHLKSQLPGKMLVLAHREELIDQNIDKLRLVNPSLRVDKEMADHHADPANADIVVASVATLGRKGTKRLEEYDWSQFDKIVVDEAHHSVAQSYMNILEATGALKEGSNKLILGVTATPTRGDGQALAKIYQKVVYSYPLRKAIEDGWLVEIRGYKVSTDTSLDGVKTVAGEYEQKQLADTVNTPGRNQLIVKAWLEKGENRQTVVFSVDIQHAKDMAEMFQKNGIKAEAIWGDDPDRATKLARHRNGDIKVIVNCGILIEGYDDWRIGCIIPAAPTKSPTKFAQIIGRVTRLEDGCGNLNNIIEEPEHPYKRDGIVIDPVDNSSRNTLVTLPTLMGMSATLDLHGKGLVASVRELEAAQQQYPFIDFSKLKDITELQAHISSIDLFEFHFPPVVDENSELSWFMSPTGSYILMLPEKEHLEIEQNLLDKWEIHGTIRGKKYRGERDTIEAAFMAADETIFKVCPEALKILRKKEVWHDDPATPDQLQCLRKFYKKELAAGTMVIPPNLTKGQASRKIGQKLAGKRKLK